MAGIACKLKMETATLAKQLSARRLPSRHPLSIIVAKPMSAAPCDAATN